MHEVRIGSTLEQRVEVESEHAITFLGPTGPRVLSTPRMILFMERACRDLVFGMLESGHDTVGTHVNVYHRKAAPIGATVTFRAEVTGHEPARRRIHFNVTAKLGDVIVGEGTHERAIIQISRFADKVVDSGRK